jgi:virulence-associated protein VagC
MSAAAKLDPVRIPDDQRLPGDIIEIDDEGREGVVIPPDMEEWFDQMMAETDEQIRTGQVFTKEQVLAKLRARG